MHGLFVLGTTGERPSLASSVQREFVGRVVRLVAGRVPVLVGISDASPAEMTKHMLEPDTIRRLADCPNIVGVKESGGDLGYFADVVGVARAMRPDWSLFVGPELLLPEAYELGGHGAIPGGANFMPRAESPGQLHGDDGE